MPRPNPTPKSYWAALAGWAAFALASSLAAYLGTRPPPPPPPPVLVEDDGGGVPEGMATGWVHDPIEVALVLAGPNAPGAFSETPAFREGPEPKAVYLWQVYPQVTGARAPVKNQRAVGSCVAFGTNTAVERTIAAAVASGRPGSWSRIAEEVTYGGSRVEVGGGRIRGDGSIGAWAAKFVTRYGLVTRGQHGRHDLREYSEQRCREYGARGVPDDLEPLAREHPVGTAALVRSWAEAKKALASGYGIAVCSSQGFDMRRDASGVCRPRGVWMHCMALDGYYTAADGREFGHITNSWGANAHTGPVGWGDPGPDGFWAESRVVDRMLRAGDSFAFSDVDGFPVRELPPGPAVEPKKDKAALGVDALRPEFALAP